MIIITVMVGYFQLKDFLQKPDLHLRFSTPKALTFLVDNTGYKVAEKPNYGFGIFDLDSSPIEIVPIPWKETSYLGANSKQGPNEMMGRYGKLGHRYFGFAAILCKNCDREKWYWIYFIHGSDSNAWYVEMDKDEPKLWNPIALMNNPYRYIEDNFPIHRRIPIK
jgi:hypothetical protein